MTPVYDWFAGLATIGGFAYFMLGFIAAYLVHCIRARLKHSKITLPWHLAGIAVGTAAIIIVTVQSSDAYNIAKKTAQEVQDCQREFNSALKVQAQVGAENDALSMQQRQQLARANDATSEWLHDILFPPAEVLINGRQGPVYEKWGVERTQAYFDTIADIKRELNLTTAEQLANETRRAQHPLPEPTCGRG